MASVARRRIAQVVGLVGLFAAGTAGAHSDGVQGESGIAGSNCSRCHRGGTRPTLTFDGPAMLLVGQTAHYTVTLKGGPAVVGGIDLAIDPDTAMLTTDTPDTEVTASDELVQTWPIDFTGGQVVFELDLTAPPTAGTITLYAAGVSANGNGDDSGDGVGHNTLAIDVADPPPPDMGGTADLSEPEAMPSGGCSVAGRSGGSGALALLLVILLPLARSGGRLIRRRR